MNIFKMILDVIIKIIRVLLMCLISGIVLVMLNELVLRNFFNKSFRGMTESAGCLFMWMAFLGIAVLYDSNRLISLDMIYVKLKAAVKTTVWYIHTIVALCLGFIMVAAFMGLYPFVSTDHFSSMPKISKVWQYLPLAIAGVFIVLKALYNLMEKILAVNKTARADGVLS
jgi:TRAP-type C4-dicarboxylate transport system permease small subunit